MSLQLAVIMVPVLFGMMGFAIDLGRLYLIRGELNQAANAMALAAAAQLVGTSASLGNATAAAQQSLDDTNHLGNKYNFGSLEIGQTTGNLTSTVNAPAFFATVADATGASGSTGTAGRRHHRAPRPDQLDGRRAAALLEHAPGGAVAQNPHRRPGPGGDQRASLHGLRNRAVRRRRAGYQRHRELRLRRPHRRHALHLRLRLHPHPATSPITGPPTLAGTVVQYVIINR